MSANTSPNTYLNNTTCQNEELFEEGDPDSNKQTLKEYLIEKGFVSPDCNREDIDVGEVPFIQSTAAEAAKAAKAAALAVIEASITNEDNVWGEPLTPY